MRESFISKLETNNFYIGSFDSYLDISKEVIKNNSHLSFDETDSILKEMPTSYRASVIKKNSGEYIGYIGLYNVDSKNNSSSIRFEVKDEINEEEKNEILDEFKKYISESLNIKNINELLFTSKDKIKLEENNVITNKNIIIPSKLLEPGISEETLNEFSKYYSIPKLQIPFTIKNSDRVIGIIGLSNLLWANKRANLNLFLDKNLDDDITNLLSGYIIDDYINYVHNSNIHNVEMTVNGSNKEVIDLLKQTNMNYYGTIPYAFNTGKSVESNLMFQHIPGMQNNNEIIIPGNKSISLTELDTEKKEIDEYIVLNDEYKMVSPKAFDKQNIDVNKVLEGHIKALQERNDFSIPLGEDKYFLQRGNENYGITKSLSNFDYVVLNNKNEYSGFVNMLSTNGRNARIEIGISPELQNKGLGKKVLNRFYDELFSVGYASVTSAVFSFNTPSIKLHDRVAKLNGIRLESYYINGKLFDMGIYSKTNEKIR